MIFQGRSGRPAPIWIHTWDCPWYYHASNLTNRYLCMFLERQVDRQTDRRVHRRPTPKQYPSDFIGGGGKPVLSTGYLVSGSRTQRSASGEARSRNPSISGQALYHDCAPQLRSILCRYDTCPTQYAPDLRGSILCMQGTQYAPRESILCMEHFVALQCLKEGVIEQSIPRYYHLSLHSMPNGTNW